MCINIPNILSFCRFPLAILFLLDDPISRLVVISLAMLTDGLDGFIARYFNQKSPLGAIIDPLADKFFAVFVFSILIFEERLTVWQMTSMLGRDFAVLLFGIYLFVQGKLKTYAFQSIWSGKLVTFMQFIILIAVIVGWQLPDWIFPFFGLMGCVAFIELLWGCINHQRASEITENV